MSNFGEFAVPAGMHGRSTKVGKIREVFPKFPRDHAIILLDHFHQCVEDVLESLADGSAENLIREWSASDGQNKRKTQKLKPKDKKKTSQDSDALNSVNHHGERHSSDLTDRANEPLTLKKRQRSRKNDVKKLDPIKVVIDEPSVPAWQQYPSSSNGSASAITNMESSQGLKRFDISELMSAAPSSVRHTLLHQQKVLLQQNDNSSVQTLQIQEEAAKVQIARPPTDLLDTDLADHPAVVNLKAAESALQEMEQAMGQQWKSAREDIRLAIWRLTQSITMRETSLMRDLERELYREVQLLAKRKSMMEQLKSAVREAHVQNGTVSPDVLMKIEEFKNFSELDLPNWQYPRFYGHPEAIASEVLKFGSLYNAATGSPPNEAFLSTNLLATNKSGPTKPANQEQQRIKLNLPQDLFRGPDLVAAKDFRKIRREQLSQLRRRDRQSGSQSQQRSELTGNQQQTKQEQKNQQQGKQRQDRQKQRQQQGKQQQDQQKQQLGKQSQSLPKKNHREQQSKQLNGSIQSADERSRSPKANHKVLLHQITKKPTLKSPVSHKTNSSSLETNEATNSSKPANSSVTVAKSNKITVTNSSASKHVVIQRKSQATTTNFDSKLTAPNETIQPTIRNSGQGNNENAKNTYNSVSSTVTTSHETTEQSIPQDSNINEAIVAKPQRSQRDRRQRRLRHLTTEENSDNCDAPLSPPSTTTIASLSESIDFRQESGEVCQDGGSNPEGNNHNPSGTDKSIASDVHNKGDDNIISNQISEDMAATTNDSVSDENRNAPSADVTAIPGVENSDCSGNTVTPIFPKDASTAHLNLNDHTGNILNTVEPPSKYDATTLNF